MSYRKEWISTAIPRTLAKRIEREVLKKGKYRSLTAFLADAAKRRLQDLKETVEVPAS